MACGVMPTAAAVRRQRIAVITRGESRRRWSVAQKREIAAEGPEPGISPITLARRYGISSSQARLTQTHSQPIILPGSQFFSPSTAGTGRRPASQGAASQ